MDPKNPSSFSLYTTTLPSGRVYEFVDQRPTGCTKDTPTIFCIHGFPDLWYGWRYQIGPWVNKGYRVVVPSMLGYAGTDKPASPEEYTTKKLCADLVALLDYLEIDKPVVVGHDWGAMIAARYALWHPSRLSALVILSIPFTPPSRNYVSIQQIAKAIPNLRYQAYFNDPASTKRVDDLLLPFMKMVWCVPGENKGVTFTEPERWDQIDFEALDRVPLLLTPEEFAFYHTEMKKGMNGPLNYYRTYKLRHDEEIGLSPKISKDLPVLFMWGTDDSTTVASVVAKAHKFVPNLQDIALEGKSHWLLVEAKDEVTQNVLAFLDSVAAKPVVAQSRL